MSDTPEAVLNQIDVAMRELKELADARWDLAENKSGSQKLRGVARRVVLSAQHLEQVVKDNSFGG